MAETTPPTKTTTKTPAKSKSLLHGKWHGIPYWTLGLGAGGALYLGYRWWSGRSSTTTLPSASTTTSSAPSSGSGYAGTGQAPAGGGSSVPGGYGAPWAPTTGSGSAVDPLASALSTLAKAISSNNATTSTPTTASTQPAANYGHPPTITSPPTVPAGLGTPGSKPIVTYLTPTSESVTPAQAGYMTNNPHSRTNHVTGTFSTPSGGTVNLGNHVASAIKMNNGQVAYGLNNPAAVRQARAAGLRVVSGTSVPGGNPHATYVLR